MTQYVNITNRKDFDLETILPIETIRVHTKTDDTPMVTDEQLDLYRKTAFEQAELYTGRIIYGIANIDETNRVGYQVLDRRRPKIRVKLKYLPLDDHVVMTIQNTNPMRIRVPFNKRKIDVPLNVHLLNPFGCCKCAAGDEEGLDFRTMYRTGYKCKEDIPSTLLYGCLKFIMWAVANPGDELLTVRNRMGTTETGLIGTNNGAWASGAIEHWMTYQV